MPDVTLVSDVFTTENIIASRGGRLGLFARDALAPLQQHVAGETHLGLDLPQGADAVHRSE